MTDVFRTEHIEDHVSPAGVPQIPHKHVLEARILNGGNLEISTEFWWAGRQNDEDSAFSEAELNREQALEFHTWLTDKLYDEEHS